MSQFYKVQATQEDGSKTERPFWTLNGAQREAAQLSRCGWFAVVLEGGQVYATWQDGKQVRARSLSDARRGVR